MSKRIIWQIQYFGVQAQSWVRLPKGLRSYRLSLQSLEKELRSHIMAYFRSHEMARKKAPIRRPDLFPCGCMSENNFWDRTKWHEKRPKYAGPIYFHADVCRKEFLGPFLLISLLRSRGSLRLPRSLRAWNYFTICFHVIFVFIHFQKCDISRKITFR